MALLCACSPVPPSPPAAPPALPSQEPSGTNPTAAAPTGGTAGERGNPAAVPIQAQAAAGALPTLAHELVDQQAEYRVVDADLHLDVVVPQLRETPGLNRQLRRSADLAVQAFRRTLHAEADRGPGRYHAMTVGWQLLAQSKKTTGIQLWVAQQHGLRVSIERVTLWYDHSSHRMLSLQDVFTPTAWPTAQEAIARAAGSHAGGLRAARAALAADGRTGRGTAFGFAADGSLLVTFPAHSRSPKAKPVSVQLAPGPLRPRLSRAGRSMASAAIKQRTGAAASERVNCRKVKCVALTFDDGPGPFTAQLAATLQQQKAPGTFFLVGDRVRQAPDLVALLDQAGMEIGNHSNDHRELTLLSADEVGKDLKAASEAIAGVIGHRPTLLRPPYGSRNPTVDAASANLGMAEILWDVDTLDWRYPDPVRIRTAAVTPARRGSIILMHDIHRTTVAAVPHIVDDLRRRGFTLVTVSQLLGDRPAPGQVYRQQSDATRR